MNFTPKQKLWIKATLLAGGSLTIMAAATIAPALSKISEAFSHNPDSEFLSRLILVLPSLIIAIAAPFMGYIIDRFGRKKLLLTSLVLYAFAGTAGYFLDNLYHILISRGVLGIAVAGNMVTITTLVADYFEGKERDQFMGLQGGFMSIGGIIFVLCGGLLADISWREPFLIYTASMLVFPMVWLILKEPSSLQLSKKPRDILDLEMQDELFSRGKIILIYIIGFIGMVIFYMVPVQLPFYLAEISEVSQFSVGLAIATCTIAAAPTAMLYEVIKSRLSYPLIYAIGFLIMGVGFIFIGNAYTYPQVITGLLISGLGFGFMIPNGMVWLMSLAPVHMRGRLIGVLNMSMFLGQFFSPFFTEPVSNETSLGFAFGLMGGVMIIISIGFIGGNKRLSDPSLV